MHNVDLPGELVCRHQPDEHILDIINHCSVCGGIIFKNDFVLSGG